MLRIVHRWMLWWKQGDRYDPFGSQLSSCSILDNLMNKHAGDVPCDQINLPVRMLA